MDGLFSKSRLLKLFGTLLGLALIYLLPLFTVPGTADIFLKVDGINGESTDSAHVKWIDALAFSHGVTRQVSRLDGQASGGKPTLSNFQVSKRTDAASTVLFDHLVKGTPKTVDMELVRGSEIRQRYYRVKLYDAFVTTLSQSSGGDVLSENVEFAYGKIEMTYTEFSAKGTSIGDVTAWYDVETQTGGMDIPPPNTAPTISAIAATNTLEDTAVTVSFTVADGQTAAGSLTLSATSSNTGLVPVSNVTFGGSGGNRTATISPVANQVGSSTVTIRVSDGVASATSSFVVTVNAVNDAPTITPIPSKATEMGVPLNFTFNISDVDHAASNLVVTAQSTVPSVVNVTNIVLSGTTSTRNISITPNGVGNTTITLTVSDGALQNTNAFLVTVNAYTPKSPTDIALSNALVPENSTNGFAIGTFSATDPDSSNHVFVLLDSAGGRFRIVGNELQVNDTTLLDYESGITSHSILVRATDGDSLSFSKNLSVSVVNINEAPSFIVPDASIIQAVAGLDIPVTRLQVADPDAGANTVRLVLEAINGIVTISNHPSLTITSNSTASVTVLGSLADLNTVLASTNGMLYRANTNLSGTDIITATLNDNGHMGLGGPIAVYTTLGVRFYKSLYEQWLYQNFTDSELNNAGLKNTLWGVRADSDDDGLENLAEYALGKSPRTAGDRPPAARLAETGSDKHLFVEFKGRRDPALTLIVEVADDVANTSWTSEELLAADPVDLNDGFNQYRFDDQTTTSAANRRFMRMRWMLDQNASPLANP